MELTRFCNTQELHLILSGIPLVNLTDHYKDGKGGSTSVGFCFTSDPPLKAWGYLKGIVAPFYCCIYEIPRHLLARTQGKYFVGTKREGDKTVSMTGYLWEWCTTMLRPEYLKSYRPLDAMVSGPELMAARILYFSKNV